MEAGSEIVLTQITPVTEIVLPILYAVQFTQFPFGIAVVFIGIIDQIRTIGDQMQL